MAMVLVMLLVLAALTAAAGLALLIGGIVRVCIKKPAALLLIWGGVLLGIPVLAACAVLALGA